MRTLFTDMRSGGARAVLAACAVTAAAAAPARDETVFACTLRNGKSVSVSARGDRLTYRYGTRTRPAIIIEGGPKTRNIHYLVQRYSVPVPQLRFSRNGFHYIVYEDSGSAIAQTATFSGLIVMRGLKRIGDHQCLHHVSFGSSYPFHELAEDEVTYSAM